MADDTKKIDPPAVACAHSLFIGLPDVSDPRECQSCDWCPVCESVQQWDNADCMGCGRTWGACVTCNADPCGCPA